jgi:hypothetical protein
MKSNNNDQLNYPKLGAQKLNFDHVVITLTSAPSIEVAVYLEKHQSIKNNLH